MGFLGHDDEEFGDPGPGRGPKPSPWLVVLLILAFCAAGVTAAAQPAAAARLVFSATDVVDAPQVTGDTVLATVDGPTGTQVTSYDLRTGEVRWEYQPPRRMLLLPAGETVVAAPVSCSVRSSFSSHGIDAGTGAKKWEVRGAPLWLVDGAPLVVIKQPLRGCSEATIGFDPLPGTASRWIGLDLASGEPRWEMPVPPSVNLAVGLGSTGHASWLAIADGNVVTTYDLRTGASVGRYEAPASAPLTPTTRILGAGDQMLVVTRTRAAFEVTGHELPGLRQRWSSRIAAPNTGSRFDMDGVSARGCGPSICLGPASTTIGLDPQTGRERWRTPGRPTRVGTGYGLFVRAPPVVDVPTFLVQDLTTGAELAALPDTSLLRRTWGDPLLNRPTQDNRLWQLDLAGGRMSSVTKLPGTFTDCDAGGRYLACRSTDGEMRVWRLPAQCTSCAGRPAALGATAVPGTDRRRPWPMS